MFGNQIAGKISCEGKRNFFSFNPILNKENTSSFTSATKEEIESALTHSASSFYTFSTSKAKDRARLLELIAEELDSNKSDISKSLPQGIWFIFKSF